MSQTPSRAPTVSLYFYFDPPYAQDGAECGIYTAAKRARDLVRIRQIYIPELIVRLHATLVNSRSRLPEYVFRIYTSTYHPPSCYFTTLRMLTSRYPGRNLKHALSLVNVVADSRYRLYDDFSSQVGRRLGDYLGAVRQAVLAGLEGGGSDPFRILTV